jgi:hypothetical protein
MLKFRCRYLDRNRVDISCSKWRYCTANNWDFLTNSRLMCLWFPGMKIQPNKNHCLSCFLFNSREESLQENTINCKDMLLYNLHFYDKWSRSSAVWTTDRFEDMVRYLYKLFTHVHEHSFRIISRQIICEGTTSEYNKKSF